MNTHLPRPTSLRQPTRAHRDVAKALRRLGRALYRATRPKPDRLAERESLWLAMRDADVFGWVCVTHTEGDCDPPYTYEWCEVLPVWHGAIAVERWVDAHADSFTGFKRPTHEQINAALDASVDMRLADWTRIAV
jgi:hypothetical protein